MEPSIGRQLHGLIREGDFAAATSLLEPYVQAHPDDAGAACELGRLLLFQKKWPQADALLSALRAQFASSAVVVALLGLRAQLNDQIEDACEAYRQALRSDGSLAWARYNLAVLLFKQQRWQESVEELTALLADQPEHYPAHFQKALALAYTDASEQVAQSLSDAIKANPLFLQPYLLLSEFLARSGKGGQAIELLIYGLQANPMAHPLREAIARILTLMGEVEAAFGVRLEICRLRGSGEDFLELGLAALRKGSPAHALVAFSKARQLLPNDWRPLYNLAEIHRNQAAWTEATALYEEALPYARHDRILNGLALCILEQESATPAQLQSAQRFFEEALQRHPEFHEARYNLALLLARLKRHRQALDALGPILHTPEHPLFASSQTLANTLSPFV